MDPTTLFKALSDPTRLRCLLLLIGNEELCVCELVHALGLPQPKISHHLAAMRRVDLVSDRKDGLWIYYRINPGLPDWAIEVIKLTGEGIGNQQSYQNDQAALQSMPNRPGGICAD